MNCNRGYHLWCVLVLMQWGSSGSGGTTSWVQSQSWVCW